MRLQYLLNSFEQEYCSIEFDETNQWLCAIWQGYVSTADAMRGASAYLSALKDITCPYLLNDNSLISGPWFDSTDWLEQVWMPQAVALGLRYVAHVMVPDQFIESLSVVNRKPFIKQIELQLFDDAGMAQEWLRECQHANLGLTR